ncbi:exonuclease family protein [Yersinia pseudotuberculosis IP 32953]|uniref:Putative conserved bacteriophage protein n=1 Tax=Yersinia pseudotuberculosis serotype I (strain IP32953) TaxID=273123 RepID=Q666W0_YERPS|nr:3'-5' exonuclease [Yersinia pseudotuberculosis]AJJ55247.1 exonuclease family protein [Yersinia pseudotuberculosis IP 32953]AJJ66634.1 exonuclease family protein [Yersinia pseudotuberculosis PB1/+]MBO1560469.1 3'-5' exonuclease [Yersinia pseudotuberculosis]CAH22374.1 putative conserved bacteriophage protein [Yersinia pseudotuberculosis IP 32953]
MNYSSKEIFISAYAAMNTPDDITLRKLNDLIKPADALFLILENEKYKAKEVAQSWINGNYLILDTETTGLDNAAEIVEISIIDCMGNVLLDTLIKPLGFIPSDVEAIHGITNKMVDNAPHWCDIHEKFIEIIKSRNFVAYNSRFDTRLIYQSAEFSGVTTGADDIASASGNCAMLEYARFHGQWDSRQSDFKWQTLIAAAGQMNVITEGASHRALSDCKTTLGVIKAMAGGEI